MKMQFKPNSKQKYLDPDSFGESRTQSLIYANHQYLPLQVTLRLSLLRQIRLNVSQLALSITPHQRTRVIPYLAQLTSRSTYFVISLPKHGKFPNLSKAVTLLGQYSRGTSQEPQPRTIIPSVCFLFFKVLSTRTLIITLIETTY